MRAPLCSALSALSLSLSRPRLTRRLSSLARSDIRHQDWITSCIGLRAWTASCGWHRSAERRRLLLEWHVSERNARSCLLLSSSPSSSSPSSLSSLPFFLSVSLSLSVRLAAVFTGSIYCRVCIFCFFLASCYTYLILDGRQSGRWRSVAAID